MKWGWCSEALSDHLERCLLCGVGETTFEIDGWKCYYDLFEMTQTSPNEEATERSIRRVRWEETEGA